MIELVCIIAAVEALGLAIFTVVGGCLLSDLHGLKVARDKALTLLDAERQRRKMVAASVAAAITELRDLKGDD